MTGKHSFAEPIAPVTLQNAYVRLEPLGAHHAADLAALTVGTGITRWFPQPLETRGSVDRYIAEALEQANQGALLPFAIVDPLGPVVGSTRYMNIAAEHRRLEIGSTFVGAPWQRSAINSAAKLLLLEHGFERLNCERIELKTDARNLKSRAAIVRIGATEEGTLRRHVICADGYCRDTVYFSILADEWPGVKARLSARLGWMSRATPLHRLDTSGLSCPLPVLKARKRLIGMRPGETLEVRTTDPMSIVDMPVFCAQAGHRIVREEKQDDGFIFAIERGER